MLQALADLVTRQPALAVIGHSGAMLLLIFLAIALMLRQFWGYMLAIITLIMLAASEILAAAAGPSAATLLVDLFGPEMLRALAVDPVIPLVSELASFIIPLRWGALILALFYGIFQAGPDFERVQRRQVAIVEKGNHEAGDYFSIGKWYAARKMWASAALNWQRAAALEPHHVVYLCELARAYETLGFYERSLDILQTAAGAARRDAVREEIAALASRVRQAQQLAKV
jgi:hypothetical protein